MTTQAAVKREVEATLVDWFLLRCDVEGQRSSLHLAGFMAPKTPNGPKGHPYITAEIYNTNTLKNGFARNFQNKVIDLVGEPFPPGDVPTPIKIHGVRVIVAWKNDPKAVKWVRV